MAEIHTGTVYRKLKNLSNSREQKVPDVLQPMKHRLSRGFQLFSSLMSPVQQAHRAADGLCHVPVVQGVPNDGAFFRGNALFFQKWQAMSTFPAA